MTKPPSREVFFEYTRIGNIMRVTALDADSGTEVVFQAPVNTPPASLQKIALSKLKYVMNKEKSK